MKRASTALLALSISTLGAMAQAESVSQDFERTTVSTSKAQDDAKGFIEGSTIKGSTKNFFAKEESSRNDLFRYQKDGTTVSTPRRNTWTQGTIIDYSSGFTQGVVGFATEAAIYNEVALERGHARIAGGGNRTLTDSSGDAVDQWSKMGLGNIKARVSNTIVTAGRQSVNTPVIAFIGNRALPSSFQGFAVQSDELSNLSFQAGSFDRVSPRTEESLTKFRSEYADRSITSDRLSMAGVDWKPSKALTASFYASDLEDFWKQYYVGVNHDLGDPSVLALSTGFNYYKTKDSGQSKLGAIDNDTYSLSFTLAHQAHSLTLAYQQVAGDTYFDYAHETNAIFLANSLLSDFNGPNEKSIQIGYGLNMAEYGVPGLKFSIYSAHGFGIDGTHYTGTAYSDVKAMNGEHHQEYGFGTAYTMQSGPLKASSVKASYTTHRATANQVDGNIRELRVVTTIPFNIL
ncbi:MULTISPECIES: OprD family porin [unclassified Pseudomonas]|uniref:OprD family porin n=1 Tax=unclassified Pseudomonas TaxID=196821 RepID=UPI002AC8E82E|nr:MULTISPECIES: OprD family porin [unclassified Pseudomonas]MEB0040391.1 OprD family porin [Pseudomonas sp. MH10]MEB0120892.1 OprD family porin [Pseudomonas sp. CCI1.2]WPX61876.1 OprD family porin [Pseudomonas sp. MH10]